MAQQTPALTAGLACCAVLGIVFLVRTWFGGGSASGRTTCSVSGTPSSVEVLDLKGCGLTTLPDLSRFTRLRKLDASQNGLSDLPALPASVRTLFLSSNAFADLPASLSSLPELRMLALRSNKLEGALRPGVLPARLRWLILTDNRIARLPSDLGEPAAPATAAGEPQQPRCLLQKVMLANNELEELPPSLAKCTHLELIRLANNRLQTIPPFLLGMPRLAWLALAGNPAVPPAAATAPVPTLSLSSLHVDKAQAPLGSGTSGVVYRGEMRGAPAAVKLYKSARTSDGTTVDEARASAAAGSASPGLVSTLALVVDDDGAGGGKGAPVAPDGIVLEWLEGFTSLGHPPSMETISRDTYADGTTFAPAIAAKTAIDVCRGLEALHHPGRRVMHGDVYAHNILTQSQSGRAKLGDFGAGFSYSGIQGVHPITRFERLEVRAWGILVAELADRVLPQDSESPAGIATRLRKLAAKAAVEDPDMRPLFAELCPEADAIHSAAAGRGMDPYGNGQPP